MTQGLITITRNGQTALKAVCGCNGNRAEALAALIRARRLSSIEEIYDAALSVEFGCSACLVVFTKDDANFGGKQIPKRYFITFGQPDCNPRWDIGKYDLRVRLECDIISQTRKELLTK